MIVAQSSDSATPWTVAHQAPLSMGFSRQEDWRGLPFPSPRMLGSCPVLSLALTSGPAALLHPAGPRAPGGKSLHPLPSVLPATKAGQQAEESPPCNTSHPGQPMCRRLTLAGSRAGRSSERKASLLKASLPPSAWIYPPGKAQRALSKRPETKSLPPHGGPAPT